MNLTPEMIAEIKEKLSIRVDRSYSITADRLEIKLQWEGETFSEEIVDIEKEGTE